MRAHTCVRRPGGSAAAVHGGREPLCPVGEAEEEAAESGGGNSKEQRWRKESWKETCRSQLV